jgi:hypothetical protein
VGGRLPGIGARPAASWRAELRVPVTALMNTTTYR